MTDYDEDPEALAWARAKVEYVIDKMRRFEKQAIEKGSSDPAQWRKIGNILAMEFIGGEGCVVAAFDERRPLYAATLREIREQEAHEQ